MQMKICSVKMMVKTRKTAHIKLKINLVNQV